MPVVSEFDPANKYIKLADLNTIKAQDIYNEAKQWEASNQGMVHPCPLMSTGYAPLGGGAYTDKIFMLTNGWKLKPYSGTYILTILGTIITDDESPRIVPPDSGQVQVVFQVVSQGIIAAPVVTDQDKQDIANLVWQHTTGLNLSNRVFLLKKIETNRWRIANNQLIIYDDDGTTPLKVFNLSGEQTKPYSERTPV